MSSRYLGLCIGTRRARFAQCAVRHPCRSRSSKGRYRAFSGTSRGSDLSRKSSSCIQSSGFCQLGQQEPLRGDHCLRCASRWHIIPRKHRGVPHSASRPVGGASVAERRLRTPSEAATRRRHHTSSERYRLDRCNVGAHTAIATPIALLIGRQRHTLTVRDSFGINRATSRKSSFLDLVRIACWTSLQAMSSNVQGAKITRGV